MADRETRSIELPTGLWKIFERMSLTTGKSISDILETILYRYWAFFDAD